MTLESEVPKKLVSDKLVMKEEEQERTDEYGKGGYHCVRIGDTFLDNRYRVIRKLGWGTFSTVWLCADHKFDDYVAIKIAKAKKSYRETALEEIKILSSVMSADSTDPFAYRIVTFLNHFTIRGMNGKHCCLVFEVMGQSLYSFQSTHYANGIPLDLLKPIIRQVLEGLHYLHTKCQLIHTDIKPENILLTIDKNRVKRMHSEVENMIGICGESDLPESFVSMAVKEDRKRLLKDKGRRSGGMQTNSFDALDEDLDDICVKIADLGNASYVYDYNNFTIQTRPYRSPEVIIGSGFGTSADIWSTACMAFELATGDTLFDYESKDKNSTKSETQLAEILEILGPLPKNCRKGKHYNRFFTPNGRLIRYRVTQVFPLDRLFIAEYNWKPEVAEEFTQFLLPMLSIDPSKRATASDCLHNQWLSN